MTPSIDLVLATIERALAVVVLPAAGSAAAREETSIAVLFVRWLRGVVDHANDAERASRRDCREALAEVTERLEAAHSGPACRAVAAAVRDLLATPPAEEIALVREEARRAKALLSRALGAAREDHDVESAVLLRRHLLRLAGRELARERPYGKETGMDPEAASAPSLAELMRRTRDEEERNER